MIYNIVLYKISYNIINDLFMYSVYYNYLVENLHLTLKYNNIRLGMMIDYFALI